MPKPRVLVLRTAGTNCDRETAFAFGLAGAESEIEHINLILKSKPLDDFDILAIPGGFSYGDDISAGKILANELKYKFRDEISAFLSKGKLIIGICNGFQVLVKSNLLPLFNSEMPFHDLVQQVSLVNNDSGKFEDRWVFLKVSTACDCVWTKGLPELIRLPVAHGEGKFICKDRNVLDKLKTGRQSPLYYCDEQGKPAAGSYPENPNGSVSDIAAISDPSGRILGLMPHPERHIFDLQKPAGFKKISQPAQGLLLLRNGVDWARKNL